MWRLFYSVCFYCLLPFVVLRLLLRALKAPAYAKRWRERFGFVVPFTNGESVIWIHAVSVGETIAAAPMVKALQARFPDFRFLVTTMTPTGSEQVSALFGSSVAHCYAPYDLPDCVSRFIKRVKPRALIVMETELWPNTIALCKKNKIPIVLANGRLSEKSARGYRRISRLITPALQQLSAAAVQQQADAERMISLGLSPERVTITGNIKFDLDIDSDMRQKAEALRREICDSDTKRLVWIAASTHKGEDETILVAFSDILKTLPNVLLVLVPRHPERFNYVADLIGQHGLSLVRRSRRSHVLADTDVLLVDTMGELLAFYGVADMAFVGGSLMPVGGHNLIEPAAWGLPIITGPHLFNFSEVSRLLEQEDALTIAETSSAIVEKIIYWGKNPNERKQVGEKALAVAEANRGALDRLLAVLTSVIARTQKVRLDS